MVYGYDYSRLQKAQDELVSSWNKLSKKGFSSPDEDLIKVMKLFKKYQSEVRSQYSGTDDLNDKQVGEIRSTIGKALNKYFARLAPAPAGNGKTGSFLSVRATDDEFEKYAKNAIKKYKAATEAGVDLSKDIITKEDRDLIKKKEKELDLQKKINNTIEQKTDEKKHAKKTVKDQEQQMKKIEKEREKQHKNAIPIEKGKTEAVVLTTTEIDNTPKQKKERTKKDEKQDKRLIKNFKQGASRAKAATPGSPINLGHRQSDLTGPNVTKRSVLNSALYGPYGNKESATKEEERKKIYKEQKENMTTRQATQEDLDRVNKKLDQRKRTRKTTKTTEEEDVRTALLRELSRIQGGLIHGRPDTEAEDLINQIIAIFVHDRKYKADIAATINRINGFLENRFDSKDAIGLAGARKKDGEWIETDYDKGEGVNSDYVKDIKKAVYAALKPFFDKYQASDEYAALVDARAEAEFGKSPKKKEHTSLYKKEFEHILSSSYFKNMYTEFIENIKGTEAALTQNLDTIQTQLIRESSRKGIADQDESAVNETMSSTLESSLDVESKDAEDGLNSETNTKQLFTYLSALGNTFAALSQIRDLLATYIQHDSQRSSSGGRRSNNSRKSRAKDENGLPSTWVINSKTGLFEKSSAIERNDPSQRRIKLPDQEQWDKAYIKSIESKMKAQIDVERAQIEKGEHELQKGTIWDRLETKTSKKTQTKDILALSDYVKNQKTGLFEKSSAIEKNDPSQRRIKLPDQEQWKKKYEQGLESKALAKIREERAQIEKGEHPSQQHTFLDRSEIYTSIEHTSGIIADIFKKFLEKIGMKTESEADRIMNATSKELDLMRAKRIETWGENRGRQLTDTGDIADVKRTKALFGWKANKQTNDEQLFQDIKLTPGFNKDQAIDTSAIERELNKVLSGPEMFKAQTGGTFRNLIGSMTGYIGMPSLEKSRAAAEGLNQVMADVRKEILGLIQDIQAKESTLAGMEQLGTAKFTTDGRITSDSSLSAQNTFTKLEEQKEVLRGALIEVKEMDSVIGKTNGKVSQIIKKIGFVMPELMQNNTIIHNINAGLDKNGKALKFQTRTAEMLNYSFQLLTRHIGQMLKNWILQLNPLRQIQKLFKNFAGYDTKWQRTMNVIKFNIQRIFKPFMEWIAQQLVNLIGLANALLKGVGKAFNKDWDLFDQSAANAEKMRQELEKAANVSAGFDELHDIGSDNSAENDLMGDIYTPQWDGLNKVLEDIGSTVGKIIKTVSGWNFWDWLAIAGAALAGFLVLKWIIGIFKGGNPLAPVVKSLSFLEKAIGWSMLIWAIAKFTEVLTDFIEVIKSTSWSDIAKALITLGLSFALLVAAIGGLQGFTALTGVDWLGSLGSAAMIGAIDGLVAALVPFMKVVKDLTAEDVVNGLLLLGGALMEVAIAVGVLGMVFTAIATTGVGLAALGILAGVLAVVALDILALSVFVKELGKAGEGIKLILEGIATVMDTIGTHITNIVAVIGVVIIKLVGTIADAIQAILEPMLNFISDIIDKIVMLAAVIAHEIGETIRTVIKTTGDVIVNIIQSLLDMIPRLLRSILDFVYQIGPAIEHSANAIMRTITSLINFIISGIEYVVNTLVVNSINGMISSATFGAFSNVLSTVEIPRFVPQYKQGTNYVPNDGLAYLHQGEAVVPKKYNQTINQGLSTEEKVYMKQMISTMKSLDGTIKQGIPVSGQFTQRGSDLVAVVNRTKSQTGADLLSNVAYAR